MVWIRTIPEDEATGMLKRYYEGARKSRGFLSERITVFSIKENNLRANQTLTSTLMEGESGLSRPEKEMIAVRVSALNHCHY
ncbi:MAG: carboxymuconolactone decarboxylase family protein [Candidatus Tectomicrobia bacterium]|uniref:Carboxymuconolactone decarboxylase family protein n=1 Tax=Tectimicrobiota bacterium TaxID=2528274 RepID=A0A932I026_UNCTE|nr:carboxymuconolactone decarboxylase family protein [Candidatus Tectomicrobia bacterium]